MRQLILLIGCCLAFGVNGQSLLLWKHYRTDEQDRINSVEWKRDSVIISLTSIWVDTCGGRDVDNKEYKLERHIKMMETRTYKSGKIESVFNVSGYIIHLAGAKEKTLNLVIPVIGKLDHKPYDLNDIRTPDRKEEDQQKKKRRHKNTDVNKNAVVDSFIVFSRQRDTIALDKSDLRKIYNEFYLTKRDKKAHWLIGVNYSPQIAYRMLLVNDPAFNNQAAVDARGQNEHVVYGYSVSVPVGITIGKRHSIYAEFFTIQQGFNSKKSEVNWSSGLTQTATNDTRYLVKSNGIGIGYAHCGVEKDINLSVDLGFSMLFRQCYDGPEKENPAELKRNVLAGKFGLGVSCRAWENIYVKIIPTFFYNFTPLNKETLKTRLFNVGLTTGIYFANKRNK
jgi:hypothetical protein